MLAELAILSFNLLKIFKKTLGGKKQKRKLIFKLKVAVG